MFKYFLTTGAIVMSTLALSQQLQGAWRLVRMDGVDLTGKEVVKIFSSDYFMCGEYSSDGKFLSAGGGSHSRAAGTYTEKFDFYTLDSTFVGQQFSYSISITGKSMKLESTGPKKTTEVWELMDEAKTELTGVWRFGARVNENGEAGQRRGPGPRQTLKILSGKYFQWAAFNTETKQFSGTGGGMYTLKDGMYTEQIQFFSRDNTRVGKSLSFECKITGTDWFHKGMSSTGNPIHEVWEKK